MSSRSQITSNNFKRKNIVKAKISKPPVERFAFNFSFLTPERDYNLEGKQVEKKHRLKLLDKIYMLSQKDIVELVSHDDKRNGLEQIPESQIKLRMDRIFKQTRNDSCEENYWVFRLGDQGRVIGKKYKNVFYILSIDTKFKQYDHG